MLFFGKENVFMCLVAFQKMFRKIFSDVWLCSWKYHRKHIFYLLLTFSHIFSVTKRIYNIIHSSKHKQNPEKKSSNLDKRRWDCDRDRHDCDRRFARSRDASIVIAIDADRHGVGDHAVVFGTLTNHADQRGVDDHADHSLSLSLSVFCSREFFLSMALSLFCACYGKCLKVKRFCKIISGSTSANFGQT